MATNCRKGTQVIDGSGIREFVENEEVFGSFVDQKFEELDGDRDGKLSVGELRPAVADIGAALGLPPQGSSPDSDQSYSEVLNQFTHGEEREVQKMDFKEVLSDILLGMAAGLKRDPIVILRLDGKDLLEFVEGAGFEAEAVAMYSQIESTASSLRECVTMALGQLTVHHGMPPSSDSWVLSNIIQPALRACDVDQYKHPITQELFLRVFDDVASNIAKELKQTPVIVAHSESTFDGRGIKRLLSNPHELDQLLKESWSRLPKDRHGETLKEYLRVTLDDIAPIVALPPFGAVNQVDKVMDESIKMVSVNDGDSIREEEFQMLVKEALGGIMFQLEDKSISVSTNSIVHEPLGTLSTLSFDK